MILKFNIAVKTIALLSIIIVVSAMQLNAQFIKDNYEVGLSGSLGSLSESSSSNYSGNYSTNNFTFLTLFADYYFLDGISVEPELGIFAIDNNSPAQFFIANICYTKMRRNSPFAFFVKLGYGISNSIILSSTSKSLIEGKDNFDTRIVNVGMGVKYILNSQIALRGECNYKFQKRAVTYVPLTGKSFTYDDKYETFSLAFGASYLF
jgi:hypothetical protein